MASNSFHVSFITGLQCEGVALKTGPHKDGKIAMSMTSLFSYEGFCALLKSRKSWLHPPELMQLCPECVSSDEHMIEIWKMQQAKNIVAKEIDEATKDEPSVDAVLEYDTEEYSSADDSADDSTDDDSNDDDSDWDPLSFLHMICGSSDSTLKMICGNGNLEKLKKMTKSKYNLRSGSK